MPSKEELLQSIQPDMKLTKDFFKRVYGYELSFPGFSDQAMTTLESAGCSKARQYYIDWVNEYETKRNAELKEVARWYHSRLEQEWKKRQKEGEERRKEQQGIQSLTRSELTELCQRLLKDGIITEPEQFVTVVSQGH